MQGDLIGLDPGIQSPGIAIFRNETLYASGVLKLGTMPGNHAAKCMYAANAIVTWLVNQQARPTRVAYEWPQIYNTDTPAKANAVLYMCGVDLSVTAMLTIDGYSQGRAIEALSYLPAEIWNSLPKSKTGDAFESPRGRRIASRLSQTERTLAVNQHDAIDAIGIGLHALGRLGIRRAPYQSSL